MHTGHTSTVTDEVRLAWWSQALWLVSACRIIAAVSPLVRIDPQLFSPSDMTFGMQHRTCTPLSYHAKITKSGFSIQTSLYAALTLSQPHGMV